MKGREVILVTQSSATHCRALDGNDDRICAIKRSHSGMVKFERNDHEYTKVRSRLQILANNALLANCV